MKTSLKAGFAQIFSCCPKNLSCPKFGGGCSPPNPPPPWPVHLCVKICIARKTAYGLVWNVTRLHPLICGGRVSLLRALHGLWGGDEWHFRLPMDIYVHLGINKGGIQRKHIFLLWVGREEHNVQTPSFSMKWCVVWLNHLTYCGTQSKKTVIIKMIF